MKTATEENREMIDGMMKEYMDDLMEIIHDDLENLDDRQLMFIMKTAYINKAQPLYICTYQILMDERGYEMVEANPKDAKQISWNDI